MFYFMFVLFFFSSIICFILQRKTILSALLSLEGMILSCIFQTFLVQESAITMIIFILVVAACESALGLTILVSISREEETDKLFFIKS